MTRKQQDHKPNEAAQNRHQERSDGTGCAALLTLTERNVAGTFLWFVSFGAKRNEHPQTE